jgi:hypothetical protein
MSKADKKQRHKAKRAAKRHEARRRESVGPVKRLADARGEAECWMSDDFERNGQAQLFAYKQGGGLSGVACFLIDEGVVGLKDAWARVGMDRKEFEEMLGAGNARGLPMHRVELEEMRRWIEGAARWAHDNGMRLPKDWVKCASLVGGVGDWRSADVSAFRKKFAGHPEDLRQRLIGEPLETYLKRDDIDFVFSDAAPYMDQRTGEYAKSEDPFDLDDDEIEEALDALPGEEIDELTEKFNSVADVLAAKTADWLATRSDTPSPELHEAWRSLIMATVMSQAAVADADEEEIADFSRELLGNLEGQMEPSRSDEFRRATRQVSDHLRADSLLLKKVAMEHGVGGGADPL